MQKVTHITNTPFFPISLRSASLKPTGQTNTPPSTPKRPQSDLTHVFVIVIIIMLSLGLCFATSGYNIVTMYILILGICINLYIITKLR